jgi:hypothetical protein
VPREAHADDDRFVAAVRGIRLNIIQVAAQHDGRGDFFRCPASPCGVFDRIARHTDHDRLGHLFTGMLLRGHRQVADHVHRSSHHPLFSCGPPARCKAGDPAAVPRMLTSRGSLKGQI